MKKVKENNSGNFQGDNYKYVFYTDAIGVSRAIME